MNRGLGRTATRGLALVEVTIALAVFALLAVSLIATEIKILALETQSRERSEVRDVLYAKLQELRTLDGDSILDLDQTGFAVPGDAGIASITTGEDGSVFGDTQISISERAEFGQIGAIHVTAVDPLTLEEAEGEAILFHVFLRARWRGIAGEEELEIESYVTPH